MYKRISHIWLISPFIIPPVYEVYRGYIVFAFSVRMFVCLSVNFFSVKDFSETALLRTLKFGTNIRYDKLYCVLKNQSHMAYQSLYLSIFSFSRTKVSVTNFSAPISDRVFKFCIHDDDNQMYY